MFELVSHSMHFWLLTISRENTCTCQQLLDKKMTTKMAAADTLDGGDHTSFDVDICTIVVKLCVDVMMQCVRGDSYTRWDDQGSKFKVVPEQLVKSIEFECVLCTG